MSNTDTPIFEQMNAWLKETKNVSYEELLESMKPVKPGPRLRLSKTEKTEGVRVDFTHIDGHRFVPIEDLEKDPQNVPNGQTKGDDDHYTSSVYQSLFVPQEVAPAIQGNDVTQSIVSVGEVVAAYFQEVPQAVASVVSTVAEYFEEAPKAVASVGSTVAAYFQE